MSSQPSAHCFLEHAMKTRTARLLIGAEGGLSSDEIDLAQAHQFVPFHLGNYVLRVETAVAAGASIFRWLTAEGS